MLKPLNPTEYGHEDALVVFKCKEFDAIMLEALDLVYEENITRDDLIKLFWKIQSSRKVMIEC
jgi:hypothetical protein